MGRANGVPNTDSQLNFPEKIFLSISKSRKNTDNKWDFPEIAYVSDFGKKFPWFSDFQNENVENPESFSQNSL